MHSKARLILFVGILCSAAAFAADRAVPTTSWTQSAGKDKDGDAYRAVSRVSAPFEIEYRKTADFVPNLTIRIVEGCNGGGWYNQTSIGSEGTVAERAAFVRKSAEETLANAASECGLPKDSTAHALDGFEAAIASLEPPEKAKGPKSERRQVIGGWALEDVGSTLGDDSERVVDMTKSLGGIDITYTPGASSGASITVKIASRCKDYSFSSGFQFDDPPASRVKAPRAEIAEAFGDYRKECAFKDGADVKIMEGFDEAFRAIDTWVKDKPFVYPPDAPSRDDADAPAPETTTMLPLPGGERVGVRGSELKASVPTSNVGHPHPTLSLRERA